MTRKDLFEHIKNCQYKHKKCETSILNMMGQLIKCDQVYHIDNSDDHVHCKYADDGCAYVLSKKQIPDHEKTCEFFIMAPIFNKLKNTITQLQESDQKKSDELISIKNKNKLNKMANDQLKKIVDVLRSDLTNSQSNVSQLQTDLTTSQTKVSQLQTDLTTSQTTVSQLQTDLIALQTTVNAPKVS